MTDMIETSMLILGSGPAGVTAAIYGSRAGSAPLLISGPTPGGQLTVTTDVENFPGFADAVQGPWLMDQMKQQARNVGARLLTDSIVSADLSSRPFRLRGSSGTTYLAQTLIIATGAVAQWLGVRGEDEWRGQGVSACATCDGFFFRGRKIAVIGGGNTAVEEALYLTNHSNSVTLIHRRESLRAERILQERLLAHPHIDVIWNARVESFDGNEEMGLTHLSLVDCVSGRRYSQEFDGAFVAIGHRPMTALFQGQLTLDESGYISVLPGTTQTSVAGVFAAGDVADHIYRQAVTAAGTGCMAALDAERFMAEAK